MENLILFSMIKISVSLLAFYFSSDFYVCKIGFSKAGFFLLISIVKLVTPKIFDKLEKKKILKKKKNENINVI